MRRVVTNRIDRKLRQLRSSDSCSDEDELGMSSRGHKALLAALADIPAS